MHELLYHSKARNDLSFQDIKSILETSRLYNSKYGITGCLLYHKHEFIQIIEGEQRVLQELFKRIEADPRHTQVVLLSQGEKLKRTFDSWSMAYHEFDTETVERLLFIDNFLAFSKLADKTTDAGRLFHYMADELLSE